MSRSINEVTIKEIENLSSIELSQLLRKLLELESLKYKITNPDISVPFNITVGDGGEDGIINWTGNPLRTKWLPNQYTFFQNKATTLSPAECVEEILEKKRKNTNPKLKTRVQKMVENNGTYILFTNRSIVPKGHDERISKFREALRLTGFINYQNYPFLVYDANKILEWTNEDIGTVTMVQGFNGISRPMGFLTWIEWSKRSIITENGYKSDLLLDGYLEQIKSSISLVQKIRVAGHSGLGKTRLVFEAFRNSPLKGSLVYYDQEGVADIRELKDYFISHQDQQNGIIIVDNCTANNHIILSELIGQYGKLKLITIGFDDNNTIDDAKIKLDRRNQFEIVEKIIKDKLGITHSLEDILYLKNLCEGYPWMANRFCNNILKTGLKNFSSILPETFILKLLFGGEKNVIEYDVIRACSVFSSFGFPDDEFKSFLPQDKIELLKTHVEYIRKNILDGSITYERFFEICQKYRREDIMERQGPYYIVKPTILAINLAADWLRNTDQEKIKGILIELRGHELGTKITERLTDLDQISKAATIVDELWGPNGFFGSAEVLNTSWGSLLFRNVVEVNPTSTALTLLNSFGNGSTAELRTVSEGRRNLVWALEKLVFRKETFSIAARILYAFAAAENENWSNNATNQFTQLFQVFLAGTEVDYGERLTILIWGLQKNEEPFTRLAILAIGRAFDTSNLMRMGGAEKQGSTAPLKDYVPPSQNSIIEYWDKLIELIKEFAQNDDHVGELARKQLSHSIRTIVKGGGTKSIVNAVRWVTSNRKIMWSEAYNEFSKALEYERPGEDEVREIREAMTDMIPNDTRNRLFYNVISPLWNSHIKDKNGVYIDQAMLNAIAFADFVVENNVEVRLYLSDLLSGDQRQTFAFGKRLGECIKNLPELLDLALEQLRKIPAESQSPELISGMLKGANDDDLFTRISTEIINDPILNKFSFYITRNYAISFERLQALFIPVERGLLSVTLFKNFQYGGMLGVLSSEEMITLSAKIESFGLEGKWTALCLLFMLAFNDANWWASLKESFIKLIRADNLLLHNSTTGTMDAYYWQASVIKLMTDEEIPEFSKSISSQIVEYCSQEAYSYAYEVELFKVVTVLFENYFPMVWPIFGDCLLSKFPGYFHLKNLLWSHNSGNSKSAWIFNDPLRSSVILDWVREKGVDAAKRIAGLMPIDVNVDGKPAWHPFSLEFIKRFGALPNVLNELSANMGTFGSWGSTVEYYAIQKILLQQLLKSNSLEVRDWTLKMLQYTEKNIKRGQLEDEGGHIL